MSAVELGLIGLGVMGRSLALNIAGRGFRVAGFEPLATDLSATVEALDGQIRVYPALDALVTALERPCALLLMVTAGEPVDRLLDQLVPLLAGGDLVVDGGNSHYADTRRRHARLSEAGIEYLGLGVSGGEHGARHGPALMAGGSRSGYRRLEPLLRAVAATVDGQPCCAYLGDDGAGHFVKTVHNGIEYAELQLLAEVYDLLCVLGVEHPQMAALFGTWNRGELNGYLTEITAAILAVCDPESGRPLVELVEDRAGQKGTGRWASQAALDLGVAAPTIIEAVAARALSAIREQRLVAERLLAVKTIGRRDPGLTEVLPGALLLAKASVYAQGFALLRAGSETHRWGIAFAELCRVWRGGCILRGAMIGEIMAAYQRNPELYNLFFDPYFQLLAERNQLALRRTVASAAAFGVPVPALGSALSYFDGLRRGRLPANLIQAQRDCFGAHGYRRIDRDGHFHSDWLAEN